MNFKNLSNGLTLIGTGLLGASVISRCIYTVEPGERAIVFDKFRGGIKSNIYSEGFHLYIPFAQEIIKYDIKARPFDYKTFTGTKDLQKVEVKLKIFYRPREEAIPEIHLQLNRDYMNKILPAIGNEISKAILAKYTAEETLKNREQVSIEIKTSLIERAKNYNIVLDDVSIYDLKFTPEYMESIEMKQVAQQEAEKYKYVVMQKEQEKIAKIIEAEGESQAAEMISMYIKKYGEAMIDLRRIEAAKHITETLTANNNVGFIPFNSNMLLSLNN